MKCTVQGGEPFYIVLRVEPNAQVLQVSENIGCLRNNRTDAVQEFLKNSSLTLVAQVTALFQKCPQLAFFRCVFTIERIVIFQQMLFS